MGDWWTQTARRRPPPIDSMPLRLRRSAPRPYRPSSIVLFLSSPSPPRSGNYSRDRGSIRPPLLVPPSALSLMFYGFGFRVSAVVLILSATERKRSINSTARSPTKPYPSPSAKMGCYDCCWTCNSYSVVIVDMILFLTSNLKKALPVFFFLILEEITLIL